MDYKIYSSTYNILNHGVGGITDEMTSYKHVFKQKKPVFPTLSVSAVVHFYSFSTVHIRPEKEVNNTKRRKYHNHTLQTKTRPDIIMHFIKQRNQFHFKRKLYVQKCVSVSVPLSPIVS